MDAAPQPIRIRAGSGVLVCLAGLAAMAFGRAYAWNCSSSIMNDCRPFGLFTQDSLEVEFVSGLFLMPGMVAVLVGVVWIAIGLWMRLSRP